MLLVFEMWSSRRRDKTESTLITWSEKRAREVSDAKLNPAQPSSDDYLPTYLSLNVFFHNTSLTRPSLSKILIPKTIEKPAYDR